MKKVSFHNYLEDLEKENAVLKDSVLKMQAESVRLEKENKKYREALSRMVVENLSAVDCEKLARSVLE